MAPAFFTPVGIRNFKAFSTPAPANFDLNNSTFLLKIKIGDICINLCGMS